VTAVLGGFATWFRRKDAREAFVRLCQLGRVPARNRATFARQVLMEPALREALETVIAPQRIRVDRRWITDVHRRPLQVAPIELPVDLFRGWLRTRVYGLVTNRLAERWDRRETPAGLAHELAEDPRATANPRDESQPSLRNSLWKVSPALGALEAAQDRDLLEATLRSSIQRPRERELLALLSR
jgi:hypothetical protein